MVRENNDLYIIIVIIIIITIIIKKNYRDSPSFSHPLVPCSNHISEVGCSILNKSILNFINSYACFIVSDALHLDGSILHVNGQQYTVNSNVHIAAFGKAVAGMVRAAEDVFGDNVNDGIASVPFGIQKTLGDLKKEYVFLQSSE